VECSIGENMATELMEAIQKAIIEYPTIRTIVTTMVIMRLVNKPLFALLEKIAEKTESKKDNELLEKIKGHKAYKILSFLLDYIGSIKLPKSKKEEGKK
jgi:hypothetical protein